MRELIATLFILISSSCVFAQQTASESASLIQSIRVEKAKAEKEKKSDKWIAGKGAPSSVQTFDGAGNLIESTVYRDNGDIFVKYVAKYEANGTKAEETYTDAKGAIRLKTVYQYDGSKRLIGKVFFGAKGEPTGEASVRYKDGKISEVINYDTKGGTTGRHVYVYKDNTVELLNYTLSGLAGRQLMTFDEQGRLTELLGYQTDISSDMRWVYHYDGKGDIVEEVVYAGGVPFKWSYEYEYDAQGNWLTQFITPVPDKPGKEKPKPVDVTRRIIGYGTASQPKTPASLSVARSVLNEETNSVLKGLISSRDISRLLDELFYTPSGGSPIPKGSLSASVIINESGKVIAAVAGEPGTFVMRVSGKNIKDAVILSVKSWRFDPTVRGGVPQSMTKLVDISFN